jgi:hypothetical protein
MKPKIKDVREPFSTLVRLVGKHGMSEVLISLAGIAQMVAQDQQEERNIAEAEWLRNQLIAIAERIQRFNEGKPSAEDQAGSN